jgi:hypothetical protein
MEPDGDVIDLKVGEAVHVNATRAGDRHRVTERLAGKPWCRQRLGGFQELPRAGRTRIASEEA